VAREDKRYLISERSAGASVGNKSPLQSSCAPSLTLRKNCSCGHRLALCIGSSERGSLPGTADGSASERGADLATAEKVGDRRASHAGSAGRQRATDAGSDRRVLARGAGHNRRDGPGAVRGAAESWDDLRGDSRTKRASEQHDCDASGDLVGDGGSDGGPTRGDVERPV
jgi:hypothetical protein